MQEHVFEYAVIRVVPRVEREEFINVGVILLCAKHKFLEVLFYVDADRIQSFYTALDLTELHKHLLSFERICSGIKEAGLIAQLDSASRFRWLTATRSTVLQASKVHPGLCFNPKETLQKLFEQLVL